MDWKLIITLILLVSAVSFAAGEEKTASLRLVGTVNLSYDSEEGGIREVFFSPSGNNLLLSHGKLKTMTVVTIGKDGLETSVIPYGYGSWDQKGRLHVDASGDGGGTIIDTFKVKAKADPNDVKKSKVYFTDQAGNRFKQGKIMSWPNLHLLKGKTEGVFLPIEALLVHDNGIETRLELGKQRLLQGVQYDPKKMRVALRFGDGYIFYDLAGKTKTALPAYTADTRKEFSYHLVDGEDVLVLLESQCDDSVEQGRYIKVVLKLCDMGGQVLFEEVFYDESNEIDLGEVTRFSIYKKHLAVLMASPERKSQLRIYAFEKAKTKSAKDS